MSSVGLLKKFSYVLSSGIVFDDDPKAKEKLEDFERVCASIKAELLSIQKERNKKFVYQVSVTNRTSKFNGNYKICRLYVREAFSSYPRKKAEAFYEENDDDDSKSQTEPEHRLTKESARKRRKRGEDEE